MDAKINEATFAIASVALSSTGNGSVTVPYGPVGILLGVRVSMAGASTDATLRLSETDMASSIKTIGNFYTSGTITSATTFQDDLCEHWFQLDSNVLYWHLTNSDGSNATGAVTVRFIYDNELSLLDNGTIT